MYMLSYERVLGTISRAVVQLLIQAVIITTFEYAGKTDVNPGIIGSIMSCNLLFTMLYFWLVYGQQLTCFDLAGSFLILSAIVLISVGGGSAPSTDGQVKTEAQLNQITFNLMMSIVFAIVSGFSISLGSVSMQQCLRVGCNIS